MSPLCTLSDSSRRAQRRRSILHGLTAGQRLSCACGSGFEDRGSGGRADPSVKEGTSWRGRSSVDDSPASLEIHPLAHLPSPRLWAGTCSPGERNLVRLGWRLQKGRRTGSGVEVDPAEPASPPAEDLPPPSCPPLSLAATLQTSLDPPVCPLPASGDPCSSFPPSFGPRRAARLQAHLVSSSAQSLGRRRSSPCPAGSSSPLSKSLTRPPVSHYSLLLHFQQSSSSDGELLEQQQQQQQRV